MTNAVKKCNYNNAYIFNKLIPITRTVGKFTFRKNSLAYEVKDIDYHTDTLWGKRYENEDLTLKSHFDFNLNKFYIGVVTNFTYELNNGK